MTEPMRHSEEDERLMREIHAALDFLEERLKQAAPVGEAGVSAAITLVLELRRTIIAAHRLPGQEH